MNCPNCGAALRFVEGRAHFRCDYCSATAFPQHADARDDGLVSFDAPGESDCPRCGLPLRAGQIEARSVSHCSTCRGVLCTHESFAHFMKLRRAARSTPDETPRPLDRAELNHATACPRCARQMETHPYGGPGAVVIDTCAACGLIWFDSGELRAIERAPGTC